MTMQWSPNGTSENRGYQTTPMESEYEEISLELFTS